MRPCSRIELPLIFLSGNVQTPDYLRGLFGNTVLFADSLEDALMYHFIYPPNSCLGEAQNFSDFFRRGI